ncbi:MAG: PIN domain-containing protein [Clostridia bacterium]|nr:PIN domain-containing protein [Clostridia bacterium]
MKNVIKEYFELNDTEKGELWDNATFVFDANIFLSLYSFTTDTRQEFFNSVKKMKQRIWMPHQVAYEYMKNRIKKIDDSQKEYDNLETKTDSFIKELAKIFNIHESDKECKEQQKSLKTWINKYKKSNLIVKDKNNDSILNKILELFDGKAGQPYLESDLTNIKKEGEERYKKHIPPGYKDSRKQEQEFDNNAYGDLILWKEILDYSKKESKNIILITNDNKEDWWNISKGQTIGPRIELRKEFIDTTKKKFHMYSLGCFLKTSNKQVDNMIIKEINRDSEEDRKRMYFYNRDRFNYISFKETLYMLEELITRKSLEFEHQNKLINEMKINKPKDSLEEQIYKDAFARQAQAKDELYALNYKKNRLEKTLLNLKRNNTIRPNNN